MPGVTIGSMEVFNSDNDQSCASRRSLKTAGTYKFNKNIDHTNHKVHYYDKTSKMIVDLGNIKESRNDYFLQN